MVGSLHFNTPGQRGVTLVELLVVVIVMAVIAAFAMMQRGAANEQFKRQNVAQELKSAFERARFDSVKRRADWVDTQARVVVEETTYTLITDRNQDGFFDTADEERASIGGQNVVIAGQTGIALPVTITFNQRGEATAVDATAAIISPVFLVCNVSCANPTQANSNILLVSPTGTVNLLAGGSELPTFSPPLIITVPPNTSINNTAVVTPTPTPTPEA